MKKSNIFICVIITVFLSIMGCSDDNKIVNHSNPFTGKLLILQVYGNAGSANAPAGVSHSFVELYNKSSDPIKLDGIGLYYADGNQDSEAAADGNWTRISLNGKTIPANSSFLILGAKHINAVSPATRLIIQDNYGDINDNNLELSRRCFKVALIYGNEVLTVQNPFAAGVNGKPITGYIDMVGARNTEGSDFIRGSETLPARNSASAAVRRKDNIDRDNNSIDFEEIRYSNDGLSDDDVELRRPRNSGAGAWNAFAPLEVPDTSNVDYSKLRFNEVSGVGGDSEKFYELINIGEDDIPLYDVKIYYNANGSVGGLLPSGKGNLTWTGSASQTIEAGKLYSLIGRDNPGSFTTGLTAARTLIITLEAPDGTLIDQCIRAADTGDYAFTEISFSRIPDGTGPFYFTSTTTPNATNGTSTAGLTLVPNVDTPIMTGYTKSPTPATSADSVNVSVNVTGSGSPITSVVLKWKLNGTEQTDKTMTASGSVYSASIAAQANEAEIEFTIIATNGLGKVNKISDRYTVTDEVIDYTQLVLNEVNGVNKWFEIYNNGATAINLEGVTVWYDNATNVTIRWTGTSTQIIQANGYFTVHDGSTSIEFTPDATFDVGASTGLSANNVNVKLFLRAPGGESGELLDTYQKTPGYAATSPLNNKAHARIPNGTGPWYYLDNATGTPGATNGTSTTGFTKFGEEDN